MFAQVLYPFDGAVRQRAASDWSDVRATVYLTPMSDNADRFRKQAEENREQANKALITTTTLWIGVA